MISQNKPKCEIPLPSETSISSSKPVSLASGDVPTSGDTCRSPSALVTSVKKKKGDISIKAKSVQIDAMTISKHCAFFYVLLDDFSITMYYFKIKP